MERKSTKFITYVSMIVRESADGVKRPLVLEWEDGRKYEIEKVISVKNKASYNSGGVGVCYACVIEGKVKELYYEIDRWFVCREN